MQTAGSQLDGALKQSLAEMLLQVLTSGGLLTMNMQSTRSCCSAGSLQHGHQYVSVAEVILLQLCSSRHITVADVFGWLVDSWDML
jgi:hypothetical protein